jgi:hypothetical protein
MYGLRLSSAPNCYVSLETVQRCHPTLVHQRIAVALQLPPKLISPRIYRSNTSLGHSRQLNQHSASSVTNGSFNYSPNAVIAASPWVERFFCVSVRSVTTTNHSLSISASLRSLERDVHSTYTINTLSPSTHPPPVPAIHPCAQNLRQ